MARRRVALVTRTHQLLAQKYSLSADNIGSAVNHHLQLKAQDARRLCQGSGGMAESDRRRATRDLPARRGPHRAGGVADDHPQPGAFGRRGEHLPEAAHRGRHPLDVRELYRAQVRRPGSVV